MSRGFVLRLEMRVDDALDQGLELNEDTKQRALAEQCRSGAGLRTMEEILMGEHVSAEELAERASSLRNQERWCEAREIYQQITSQDIAPIDKAKMLANLMQMYEKEKNVEAAISTGEQVLQLIERHHLYDSNEGVHLRGFTTGSLRRLHGESFPWGLTLALLSGYFVGAALGATIGAKIEYEGLTVGGMVWADLRYGGAGIGAIVGLFIFSPILVSRAASSIDFRFVHEPVPLHG